LGNNVRNHKSDTYSVQRRRRGTRGESGAAGAVGGSEIVEFGGCQVVVKQIAVSRALDDGRGFVTKLTASRRLCVSSTVTHFQKKKKKKKKKKTNHKMSAL
jgi:hypothetical protein